MAQFCKSLLRLLNIIIVSGGGLERSMQRRIFACFFSCNLLSLAKSVAHRFITISCYPFVGTILMPGQIFKTEKSETWCWPWGCLIGWRFTTDCVSLRKVPRLSLYHEIGCYCYGLSDFINEKLCYELQFWYKTQICHHVNNSTDSF